MAQNKLLKIQLFASGYCEAHAYIVNKNDGYGKTKFYAVWALMDIPHVGYVMFDTGYSSFFRQATQRFPDRLYRWATPMNLDSQQSAKAVLQSKNIGVNDVKYIIISHFHADHIAGLKDFPQAQFICSKSAYDEIINLKGVKAVSKGILHGLIPADFMARVNFIEDIANVIYNDEVGLREYQLFNLENLRFVHLPGHARGMLGFIYKKESDDIFYGTDASWSYYTYANKILPHKIVNLFIDSWSDFVQTQERIKAYESLHQSTILFTHCPKTLQFIANEI
ncbi:MAG TPA: MBL fold metallo-hydrolase [Saprospiraceae bacterium]|nr:MBL fold metallo-hydrolase [Saprospiraceae bacterium]